MLFSSLTVCLRHVRFRCVPWVALPSAVGRFAVCRGSLYCLPLPSLDSRRRGGRRLQLLEFLSTNFFISYYFCTSGCPFGEGCHFLHYVPGGIKAVSQMINVGTNPAVTQAPRNTTFPPSFPDGSSPPAVKTRLCNKYNTAEGCKFGEKCHFAHGEWELGKPTIPSYEDPRSLGQMQSRVSGRVELPPPAHGAAASFGASATAKISINASLAGAIIGKNGVNSKQICRVTGAKLSIRDHESDPSLKNIELEGSFDQIKQASAMVRELIVNVGSVYGPPLKSMAPHGPAPASNFKTKPCENFAKGSCTFGDRCHFAHGAEELRKSGM